MTQTTAGPCAGIRLSAREGILAAVRSLLALDTPAATVSLGALDFLRAICSLVLYNLWALPTPRAQADIGALADLGAVYTSQLLGRRFGLLTMRD